MKAKTFTKMVGAAAVAMVLAAGMAFAQGEANTAYVPFIVNVDATVKAEREGAAPISINVSANTVDTLKISLGGTVSVRQRPRNAQNNTPLITANHRGNVSLYLPGQSYQNAEVSLYSVNGRRVLRANANASQTANNISRPNLVAGVYLMSVTGINGQNFSSRLTHRGGNLNINVLFGGENFAPPSPVAAALSRQAVVDDSEEWTIIVSADGYVDSSYTMGVVAGMNPLQTITLNPIIGDEDTFTDSRDNQVYRIVTIGTQTWMAENLNWAGDDGNLGACYANNASNCNLYGRLYDWETVMGGSASSSSSPSGVRGICPVGWHVPSDAEWTTLTNFVGSNAGNDLKSRSGWHDNGYVHYTYDFGFSALPGGERWSGDFYNAGYFGNWWSATEFDATNARFRYMYWDHSFVSTYWYNKSYALSLRCLRDD
jgi:uncharacterized protein (TIGR02145 family)